ncbi:MAG: nucleotide exchange factor GrpE [Candidatus Colwellbacteria bacterium]|nr:nucleotide exchange factor GrpE [Candidatus Colwellbacteria bacterium]
MSEQEKKEEKKEEQKPESEVENLKKEKEEYLDGWKRAKADLINYKKDELRRLEEVARFGSESLILELISILDDFDLALATLEKQPASAEATAGKGASERGIYLIRSRFEDILKRRGLERIEVKVGDKFDPAFHEAIATADSPADSASVATSAKEAASAKAGTIAEEIEAGYTLHGKVIRPTRVKVYK